MTQQQVQKTRQSTTDAARRRVQDDQDAMTDSLIAEAVTATARARKVAREAERFLTTVEE